MPRSSFSAGNYSHSKSVPAVRVPETLAGALDVQLVTVEFHLRISQAVLPVDDCDYLHSILTVFVTYLPYPS